MTIAKMSLNCILKAVQFSEKFKQFYLIQAKKHIANSNSNFLGYAELFKLFLGTIVLLILHGFSKTSKNISRE